jgi:hypothetical protein
MNRAPNNMMTTISSSKPITFPKADTTFNSRISRIINNTVARTFFMLFIILHRDCNDFKIDEARKSIKYKGFKVTIQRI